MARDKTLFSGQLPLVGRLVTSHSGTLIGDNFKSLKNLRYTDSTPKGIKGMSKINTTSLSAYPKIRSGIHLKKSQPSESHVLVQAENSGETESKVFENKTVIPSVGDFEATALHTDASSAGLGRFSKAPSGNIMYCNGSETMVWGGDEHFCSGFVNHNPDGSFSKDYTNEVSNTQTDSVNIATLKSISTTIDANTMLLLHMNSDYTDSSPTTPHTVTANGGALIKTDNKKWGAGSGFWDGTDDYLSIPDDADFDLSDGTWTIDLQVYVDNSGLSGGEKFTLYYHGTDANNYFHLYAEYSSATSTFQVKLDINIASSITTIPGTSFSPNTWVYIEATENGDTYRFIVSSGATVGVAETTSTVRASDYTGSVYIGASNISGFSDYFSGYIDELRISDNCRHPISYEIPSGQYGDNLTYIDIAALRPLSGIRFAVETANTSSGSMSVFYWNDYTYISVASLTDGTAAGGISLAQDGIVSFDTTTSLAKVKITNNVMAYWYRVVISNCDDTTTISNVTLDMPFQSIKDIWDGDYRTAISFMSNVSSVHKDYTVNVFEGTYDSTNTATYANIGGLVTTDHLVMGFSEKQMAFNIKIVGGNGNTTSNTTLTVKFWDGSNWIAKTILNDGTSDNGISFAKSGIISIPQPTPVGEEHKKQIDDGIPLYFYQFTFSQNLSANTYVYYISGIPQQKEIKGFKFPIFAQNRIMLGCETSNKKNKLLIGATSAIGVFNGNDTTEIELGNEEELTSGVSLYNQYGSRLYNLVAITKANETWLLEGDNPGNWKYYQISDTTGCVAPLTMQSVNLGRDESFNAAIWQSSSGVYLFDGRQLLRIDLDIEDVFESINSSKISDSVGFYDERNKEYHWLIATGSSTTLNDEYVYDILRKKWYRVDRGTGANLQFGMSVSDTSGNVYNYGSIDTGYLERLENGTTFDGNDIVHELQTGDNPLLQNNIMVETKIRKLKLIGKEKSTTTNNIAVTHYGDTSTTGKILQTVDPTNTGYEIFDVTKSFDSGNHIFHSFRFNMTTNDETTGFEPLYVGTYYYPIREDIK